MNRRCWALRRSLDWTSALFAKLPKENGVQDESNRSSGLAQFNTDYNGMAVNAYLVWDPSTRVAAAFDTGADSKDMVRFAKHHKLDVATDSPHACAPRSRRRPTLSPRRNRRRCFYVRHANQFPAPSQSKKGKNFVLEICKSIRDLTWGHSPGGITYVVTGLAQPIAIVGDSLFAGSMGGGNVSYRDALQNNLEKILTLPDETSHLSGTRPDDHCGRRKTAQPVLCRKDLMLRLRYR